MFCLLRRRDKSAIMTFLIKLRPSYIFILAKRVGGFFPPRLSLSLKCRRRPRAKVERCNENYRINGFSFQRRLRLVGVDV